MPRRHGGSFRKKCQQVPTFQLTAENDIAFRINALNLEDWVKSSDFSSGASAAGGNFAPISNRLTAPFKSIFVRPSDNHERRPASTTGSH